MFLDSSCSLMMYVDYPAEMARLALGKKLDLLLDPLYRQVFCVDYGTGFM